MPLATDWQVRRKLLVRLSAIAWRIATVQEITQGGAESVLECVGSESAMATAIAIAPYSRQHKGCRGAEGKFATKHFTKEFSILLFAPLPPYCLDNLPFLSAIRY
ncbi:hypothetical protein [Nostoc sp. DedQUE09]|uniref:hypothetical protein n=1 Tax=Nostoc sp. DedQUE09 TaxID=3075394 RepID=UPI002AD356C9|nr:hypothetical protein [Nostoc sp. DedQUE09]MDZ7951148.1 hypothetical protein [Nostoc sp. DedQUE09]